MSVPPSEPPANLQPLGRATPHLDEQRGLPGDLAKQDLRLAALGSNCGSEEIESSEGFWGFRITPPKKK